MKRNPLGTVAGSWWDSTEPRGAWLMAFGRSGWRWPQDRLLLAQAVLPAEGSANTANAAWPRSLSKAILQLLATATSSNIHLQAFENKPCVHGQR